MLRSNSRILNATENYANELDTSYNRFHCLDFSAKRRDLRELLENLGNTSRDLAATENEVHRLLLSVSSEATDLDRLSPRSLKSCAGQLKYNFTSMFNPSLTTLSIPALQKQSCIIPVSKEAMFQRCEADCIECSVYEINSVFSFP